MPPTETWDIVLPEDPQDFTSKSFHQWKAEVMRHTDMAEYRLRKLYKLGFSPESIQRDEHHRVYPPYVPVKARIAPSMRAKRGKTLGAKKHAWIYARALHEAAQGVLAFYRLDAERLAIVRADVIRFKALMDKFGHKKPKDESGTAGE